MLKKIIFKLFDLLGYSIIVKKKLTKIDIERKIINISWIN